MAEPVLFVGPSAHGLAPALLDGLRVRPPVRRGDIDRLRDGVPAPGVIVVCDGVFQAEPAVSHAELCRALDAGWQVWGVSSLGAIRAWELRNEGMRGFGWVHAQFARFDDFTDDEMCLLHFPEPPYFPVSEALVNLRYALAKRKSVLGISDAAEGSLLEKLRGMWFGDRTRAAIRDAMLGPAGLDEVTTDTLLAWLDRHRVKCLDLAELLARRPWQAVLSPTARGRSRRRSP
jgi:hypothetical protein